LEWNEVKRKEKRGKESKLSPLFLKTKKQPCKLPTPRKNTKNRDPLTQTIELELELELDLPFVQS